MGSNHTPLGSQLGSSALRYARRLGRAISQPPRHPASHSAGNPARYFSADSACQEGARESVEAKLGRLEAVLFLAREPLSTRKLAALAQLADGTEARTLLRQLSSRYDQRCSALQLVELAGGFQMLTRPQLADWIRRLHGESEELRLSAPAMETLSVVAYRQPVLRVEVEAIRGVQCGEILRVLMERDLLRIVGRSEELGRPFLYGTTRMFLQVFGLRRLEELPQIEQDRHCVASA